MKLIEVAPHKLTVSPELTRSRTSKVFEEHLRASIEEMGLAEPLKVAPAGRGNYLVIDGMLRLKAIQAIRQVKPTEFKTIPAYVVDLARRYEIRFQTDIYQDLLPSQLAALVEHLHQAENVRKVDIAKSIGVSPATLRNYTGLWRLMRRGGLFAQVVELMDVGVFPASNPFAWLRLTEEGLRYVIENSFSDYDPAEGWIEGRVARARRGDIAPYPIKVVETVTGALPSNLYREDEEVRATKKEFGLRRAAALKQLRLGWDSSGAIKHLGHVRKTSKDPVLQLAARSLAAYLQ
jgi:ParB-like nuclease domain